MKTILACCLDNISFPPEDTEVWIINTQSRSLKSGEAVEKVRRALKLLKEFQPDYIYKKIDSTLRGNIGYELEAAAEEMNLDSIPLCAAFPEMGRTTVKGVHYVNGKTITDTQYASDINAPVKDPDINSLLSSQMEDPKKVRVLDASTSKDMEANCSKEAGSTFFSGASDWAGKLTDAWMASPRKPESVVFAPAPVLVISGSLNPVSIEQINYFKKVKEKDSPDDLIATDPLELKSGALKKMIKKAKKKFLKSYTRALLVGGETSDEFLKEIDVNNMEVVSSPMSGISLVSYRDYFFILKPGGFGKKEALVNLCALLGGK